MTPPQPSTDAPPAPLAQVHEATRPPAWSSSDLAAADPHTVPDKPDRVRRMFAAIARSYDLNNRLHSLWRDQAWRRRAVKAARVRPGDAVLDVACGTGDLSEAFARRSPAGRVLGIDFTPQMLDIARHKQTRLPPCTAAKLQYAEGDAQALAVKDASFDVISIAFGIRNVADPARAIAEFARILRPGGRLVILEFAQPTSRPLRWLNDFYCGRVMPFTATLISGDRSGAYKYLPKSVGAFMTPEALAELLARHSFQSITTRRMTLGICCLYSAVRT
jgi:demethylmenaquinone methyltransferase / 2-methoxy-6-polyprenyl-1,4-benzoquinol methylase